MTNFILEKLGLSTNDRAFILHADDIGLLQATVPAYEGLLRNQRITAASFMVPCPWFPSAAKAVGEAAGLEQLDVGVHVTLTSEWNAMRWGPLSAAGRQTESGLLDNEGYFFRTSAEVQGGAQVSAVEEELKIQVERARLAGIDITHLDSHMGSIVHPRFLATYVGQAMHMRVPAFLPRLSTEAMAAIGFDPDTIKQVLHYSDQIEAAGYPLFDSYSMLPLGKATGFEARLEIAKQTLNEAPAGLHYLIIHPAIDTPELRATASDWEARAMDYTLFMSDEWAQAVGSSGVKLVSMRDLRKVIRGE
ncbi:MAG: polysaccharide deacetylase family protein [Chloroflexota bacterium]